MIDDYLNNGSENVSAKSLWSDQEKTRQFLIPDTLKIPSGDFVLHTRSGREMRVNEDAVLAFEVSDDEANAWLKAQLRDVMGQLGAGLRNSLFGASQQNKEKDEAKEKKSEAEEEKESSTTPGLDLLADISGTPRESMNGNYSAIGRALREYLGDIASTVGDSVSGEPKREAAVRTRMNVWKETLGKHGIKVADKGDEGKADTASPEQSSKTFEASGKGQKPEAAENEGDNSKSGIGVSQEPHASKDKGDHADDTSSHDSPITAFKEAEERLKTQLHKVGEALQRLAKVGKARADANRDDESIQNKPDE